MGFKKVRSVRLSYAKQGVIYFTCLNYRNLDRNEQEYIKQLCKDIAGGDYRALMDVMTKGVSVRRAAADAYISEKKLYRWRKEFYETF